MLSGEEVAVMLSLPSSSLLQPQTVAAHRPKAGGSQFALMDDQGGGLVIVRSPFRFVLALPPRGTSLEGTSRSSTAMST